LDPQKGLDRFLPELPAIFAQVPQHDLLLVGDGPQEPTLRRLCKKLKIHSRIHFAGWQADIPAILAASDLVILPSRWEGLPNALLEAMAAGKPVAAIRAEGVAQILGEENQQQLAAPGDYRELSKLIAKILLNTNLAQDLGASNRSRVQAQFSLSSMTGRYENLYQSLAR
jgi:glycosyltransferase involved in cell wall biosynthesis